MDRFPAKFKLTRVDVRSALARDNLSCPDCGYSLRGLSGDIVRCPECGKRCDVAAMIRHQWSLPWRHAPGFNTVVSPAAWPVLGLTAMMLTLWVMTEVLETPTQAVRFAFFVTMGVGWLWSMARVWRWWPGPAGARLAILAHFVVAGFFALFAGLGFCIVFFIFGLTTGRTGVVILSVLATALLPGGITLCDRGQRVIADRCIRRYLNQSPPNQLSPEPSNPA